MARRPAGLTAFKVATAKAKDGKRTEYPDAGQRGLFLVVQPSGKQSWAVRYRTSDGRPRKLTLTAGLSLADAREEAQEALKKVASGGDPAAAKKAARHAPAPSGDLPIADAFALYLDKHKRTAGGRPIRASTKYEAARLLGLKRDGDGKWMATGNGATARLPGRTLGTVTRADIRLLITDLAEDRPVLANRTLAVLKAAFGWLVKQDLIAVSPAAGIDKPAAETPRGRVPGDSELLTLWRAADAEAYPYGDLTKLLILTGTRHSEARKATWDEFDLVNAVWSIPEARTKNGRAHVVPLSAPALALLQALPRIGNRFLFTYAGDKPATNVVRAKQRLHKAMTRELGAEPAQWGFHDLRRTLATGLQRMGFPQEVTEACINHRSGIVSGVAAIYSRHDFKNEKRAAFDAWGSHITSLVEGTVPAENVVPFARA